MAKQIAFRNRALPGDVSRLEGFSDAVFGFALTLIVVSLEVPSSFDELIGRMRGLIGFAICFAMLVWVWFEHQTFFRRYALSDVLTTALNTILLFIVLVYVYPLKFLFTLLTGGTGLAIRREQFPTLMTIYAVGFIGMFLMLFLMYVHAYRISDELQLNEVERYDTRSSLILYGAYIAIGLLSLLLAQLGQGVNLRWSGLTYGLIGPVAGTIGALRGARRGKIFAPASVPEPPRPDAPYEREQHAQ
jgi:uncharacterized membrane protein